MGSSLVTEELLREIFILEDENNPGSSKIDKIYPRTILDQVFDQLSPGKKNLRIILEELKQEIMTGGLGTIIFPVTSVNGLKGDIIVNKERVGLGNVDNTRDIDKPLSGPQRNAVLDLISNYNFSINLGELYDHLSNVHNPHNVTFEDINAGNQITDLVQNLVMIHNTTNNAHNDIRRNLSKLWLLTEHITGDVDHRINVAMNVLNEHLINPDPHTEQMILKEDRINKALSFEVGNIDHTKYPSSLAVSNFMTNSLETFRTTLPNVVNWIDSINSEISIEALPPANESNWRKGFFVKNTTNSEGAFAICKKNPDNSFSWDICTTGSYSKFDPHYFLDTPQGLTLRVNNITDDILGIELSRRLENYYDIDYMNDNFIKSIHLLPGTMNGNIRFYINNDQMTMSDEIPVMGLKKYAFMEELDEHDIHPLSISNQHLQSHSVTSRNLDGRLIQLENMNCRYGYLIGNTNNPTTTDAHEIDLMQLADFLRPLIGGWPDPALPGTNPWQVSLDGAIASPHLYTPEVENSFSNHSYVMRFTGIISADRNFQMKTVLSTQIKLGPYSMIEAGGAWVYQSNPKSVAILGGSNITGHTYGTVTIDENGLYLETISIGDRMNAPYDIWVRYVKPEELESLSIPGYLTEFIPATDIYNIPSAGTAGMALTLTGNVIPNNATYQQITWSLDTGSTAPGAAVIGNQAICENTGYVNVKATIKDGTGFGTDLVKQIAIYFNFN